MGVIEEEKVVREVPVTAPPADLIRSLRRGLAVLDYVGEAPAPVLPREVATELGLNISTTYHLINTLVYDGYLERQPSGALALGAMVAKARPTAALTPESVAVRRVLGRGAYAAEDSAVMALPQRGRALVVACEAVPGGDSAGNYAVGSSHLLHGSAVGRVMLATAPPAETEALLEHAERMANMNDECFRRNQVLRAIEQVRARGVCFALTERDACVGVPVYDALNRPVGALALVLSPDRLRENPRSFVRIAQGTSRMLTRELSRWGVDARSAAGSLAA